MSVKAMIFKNRESKTSEYPVVIQAIVNRKVFRKTIFTVNQSEWDEKKSRVKVINPHHVKMNELIIKTCFDVENRILQAKIDNEVVTKEYLFNYNGSERLSEAIDRYMTDLKARKKYGMIEKIRQLRVNVVAFSDQYIKSCDDAWGERFYRYLRTVNNENTAAKKVSYVNTVLMSNKITPMKVRMQVRKSTKDKLTKDEVLAIQSLQLTGRIGLVRDAFLLAFYLRGRRIGDVLTLQKKHVNAGRLIRDARKTEKEMNIRIVAEAMDIITRYAGKSEFYILPLMTIDPIYDNPENGRYRNAIKAKTALVNKYLKVITDMAGIEKNVSTHVARHTFAYLADQFGMTGKRIQDMLEHSDLKTTENYIHDLKKGDVLDESFDRFMDDFRR